MRLGKKNAEKENLFSKLHLINIVQLQYKN